MLRSPPTKRLTTDWLTPDPLAMAYCFAALDNRLVELVYDELALELTDADGLDGSGQSPELSQRYLYGSAIDQILAVEDAAICSGAWGITRERSGIQSIRPVLSRSTGRQSFTDRVSSSSGWSARDTGEVLRCRARRRRDAEE
ncbi:MAG: hypothetical protein ACYC6Y_20025 [Thermoguttaceae bacterium]